MRLTNNLRAEIVRNATKNAFAAEYAKAREELIKVGDAIYRSFVTKDEEEQARKAGLAFVTMDDSISIRILGRNGLVRLQFSQSRPITIALNYAQGELEDATLIARLDAARDAETALNDRKEQLMEEVRQVVHAYGTVEALLAAWPEGKPFIPKVESKPPRLPAVIPSTLTAALKQAGVYTEVAAA